MRVCIYLPALIDNILTHLFIRSIYLRLCSISCCFWRPHKQTHWDTKSNTNTSHNSQNHSINKNDSVLHLSANNGIRRHTRASLNAPHHTITKCNKIYRFRFVTQTETHIVLLYVRSFCFMSESIEFMRSICSKSTNDTVFYYSHKAIQLFVLHSL